MSDYSEYFLNSRSDVKEYETLEITHPSFTKAYRIVRNNRLGIVARIQTTPTVIDATFDYYPAQIKAQGSKSDLDYSLQITLGDLGEVIPKELDLVNQDDAFNILPQVVYRTYRSDDLTKPLFGPIFLEIDTFTLKREGASFNAKAPQLNSHRTGEYYALSRFPMLRGVL